MKSFHKRFFLVLIVVAPIYWLVFTEDGRRRSDTVILWLFGGDPIHINFQEISKQYSKQEWMKVFQDVDWQCSEQASGFGESLCYSEISSYNGIPANYISVFFKDSHVNAVKLVYRNQYHQQLGQDLLQQLGTPIDRKHESADNMLQWTTEHGSVMIKTEITPDEEASLIWISN